MRADKVLLDDWAAALRTYSRTPWADGAWDAVDETLSQIPGKMANPEADRVYRAVRDQMRAEEDAWAQLPEGLRVLLRESPGIAIGYNRGRKFA